MLMPGGGAPPFQPMPPPGAGGAGGGLGGFPAPPQQGGFLENPLIMGGLLGLAAAAGGSPSGPAMGQGFSLAQNRADTNFQRHMQMLQLQKLQHDMARQQAQESRLAALGRDPAFRERLGPMSGLWGSLPAQQQATIASGLLQEQLAGGTIVESADGFKRYATGPNKGQRVFPEAVQAPEPANWATIPKTGVRFDKTTGRIHPDDMAKHQASLAAGDTEALDFEGTQKLRKEYQALPTVKQANAIATDLSRIEKLATDKTGFADHSLVFSYMKILDPESVVREGEFYYATNVGSVEDRVKNWLAKTREGDTLTDAQRQEIVHTVRGLANSSFEAASAARNRYSGYAREYGVRPELVVGDQLYQQVERGEPPRRRKQTPPAAKVLTPPAADVTVTPQMARDASAWGINLDTPGGIEKLLEEYRARQLQQTPPPPGTGLGGLGPAVIAP